MNLGLLTLYLALPVLITGTVFLSLKIQAKNLRFLLAFSAAYLFAISVTHLLPECYENSNYKLVGLFILIGFLVSPIDRIILFLNSVFINSNRIYDIFCMIE